MRSNLTAGAIAGLVAGVVFGVMMTVMSAPTPDGGGMPMMAMVAQVVGSSSLAIGWIYHLLNSAVIGGVFGWALGSRVEGYGSAAGWGRPVTGIARNTSITPSSLTLFASA
jgi:hypothetical protein